MKLKLSSNMSLVPLKQLPLDKRLAMLPEFSTEGHIGC